MAFENNTNLGRVEKIIDTLHLIEKSATSNKATPAQTKALLAPLIEALAPYIETAPQGFEADPAPRRDALSGLKAGERAALHLADGASLRQLIAALMGRLDAHAERLADTETEA